MADHVYTQIHDRKTLFCNCQFDRTEAIHHTSCPGAIDEPDMNGRLGDKVVWVNVVPDRYLDRLRCANESQCGLRIKQIGMDAHALFPLSGIIAELWSGRYYSIIPGEARMYGSCDLEVEGPRIEPGARIRGDLARAVLYMSQKYGFELTSAEKSTFDLWHSQDPPDQFEIRRNERIQRQQGDFNTWIAAD